MRSLTLALAAILCVLLSPAECRTARSAVAWFAGTDSVGLKQSNGRLLASGAELTLDPAPTGKLFAAAFYPKAGVLATVGEDAVVRLYRGSGSKLKLECDHTPLRKAQMRTVRFSSVPGLVYVLWDDVKLRDQLVRPIDLDQRYSDVYERVVLDKDAENWHAIPLTEAGWHDTRSENGNGRAMLPITYSVRTSQLISLNTSGRSIQLALPHPLDQPFRSGPGDPLAEAVFVIRGKGIVCKTQDGWSLSDLNGKLVKWFRDEAGGGWWANPSWTDGSFFVSWRCPSGGTAFRMDMASGKLVAVK